MEVTPALYAIVDGAIEDDLLTFLREKKPPHCCLFPPPVQPEMVALAPYLIGVTTDVFTWLDAKDTPWGIYLYSPQKIHLLVQHFRRYLWVSIPVQNKPVLFRFYDPRNIWALMEVLTPRELFLFTEPLHKICTLYANEERERDFPSLQISEGKRVSLKDKSMLMFTHKQYSLLNKQAQDNYISKLSLYIHNYYQENNRTLPGDVHYVAQWAEDCFMFCLSLNIIDDLSIRGMTFLMLENDIKNSDEIPSAWVDSLNNPEIPAHNQVEILLLQELGFIPQ